MAYRHILRRLAAFFILPVAVFQPAAAATPTLVIEHVTVLPITPGSVALRDQTVVIKGSRIALIGPSASTASPKGAQRINGRGKWLMPSLADMHVHMPNDRMVDGISKSFFRGAIMRGAPIRQSDAMIPYISMGVLQLLNMSAMSEDVGFRASVETGEVLGPHISLAAMVDGEQPIWPIGMTRVATSPEGGRQLVRDVIADGYDFIKTYSKLDTDTYRAIVDEGNKRGMRSLGHLPARGTGTTDKWLPGLAAVAHAEEFAYQTKTMSDRDIQNYVDASKRNGTRLISTLVTNETILSQMKDPKTLRGRPEHGYVHPKLYYIWTDGNPYVRSSSPEGIARLSQVVEFNRRLVKAFVKAGIPVMPGTDTIVPGIMAGKALHQELKLLVEAGMTNSQALESATRLPAEWLGVLADRGTIEVGKRADLLLLDADPLADIGNTQKIAAVIREGHYLPQAKLATMLKQLAGRYAAMDDVVLEPPVAGARR